MVQIDKYFMDSVGLQRLLKGVALIWPVYNRHIFVGCFDRQSLFASLSKDL